MGLAQRARDIQKCLASIGSFSAGQAEVIDWDEESLRHITLQLAPTDGLYRGGRWRFTVTFTPCYPAEAPDVHCDTAIYHPNIDVVRNPSNVCLNLLDSKKWNKRFGLQDIVMGLLFLFYHPNLDSPLNTLIGRVSEQQFLANVAKSLRGCRISGQVYPRMIQDDEDSLGSQSYRHRKADEILPACVTSHIKQLPTREDGSTPVVHAATSCTTTSMDQLSDSLARMTDLHVEQHVETDDSEDEEETAAMYADESDQEDDEEDDFQDRMDFLTFEAMLGEHVVRGVPVAGGNASLECREHVTRLLQRFELIRAEGGMNTADLEMMFM